MINQIINNFKNLENITYKIMKNGLKFCFGLCLLSTLILVTYNITLFSPMLYHTGLLLFKLSCTFAVEFIICGLVVDSIKKQLV